MSKSISGAPRTSEPADKRTLGVTKANEARLAILVEAGYFGSELEAAKFAMAHAINQGSTAVPVEGAPTKWNVGTVDPDGSLKALIEALYPEAREPYRLVEQLMNEGLRLLDPGNSLPPDVPGILFSARKAPTKAATATKIDPEQANTGANAGSTPEAESAS